MSTATPSKRSVMPKVVRNFLQAIQRCIIKWSVRHPFLSISLFVIATVALLPLVTAATLMPLSLLLTSVGAIASQGVVFITYNILIQGLLLGAVIIALFIGTFTLATSASVLHSYRALKFCEIKEKL